MNLRDSRVWLLILCLLHFAVHQLGFHAVFLDSDQLVIADQAAWMARGEFFEPFFFGQAYLFPFEAYLAVPLIWLGMTPLFAAKLVAAVAFYLPFVLSIWVLGRERPWAAWAAGLLLFCLPLEFLLAGPMPRGFIVAIALAWFGVRHLLQEERGGRVSVLAWGAVTGFSLASYMSVALLLPALALVRSGRRLAVWMAGLGLGFALFKAVALFYKLHPEYVVHRFPKLRFSQDHFLTHLLHEQIGGALLGLLLLTVVAALAGLAVRASSGGWRLALSWRHGLVLAGLLAVLAAMLATNKIADFDPGTPFFSVYRLVLPLPLLGLLVMMGRGLVSPAPVAATAASWHPALQGLALALMLGVLGWHAYLLPRDGQRLAHVPSSAPTVSYEKLQRQCARLQEAIRRSGDTYYQFRGRNDALAYGCLPEFGVPVVQRDYERRTWLKERLEQGTP